MPITERRLRLSRHVHAPYTTKGKERCTSTDTPGRVFGILFSLARCYPSGCASCSASLVIYLIEAVCITAYYLGALFKTGINTAAVIALMGSKKVSLQEALPNISPSEETMPGRTFALLEGMSVSFWYYSVWAHDWRSPRWLKLPQLLVLMELCSEVCFWRKSAGWLQLSVDIAKQISFSFYCGENKYGAYTRKIHAKLSVS